LDDKAALGAAVLDDVQSFLKRFVAYPSPAAAVAHTLWIAHTHGMDAWDTTPRIAFLSPEPGSGKTRCLEITELLVPNPVQSVNVSPSYLFRKVSDAPGLPTLLFDEIDCIFGAKASNENKEVLGLLNSGYRRGAVAGRCVTRGKEIHAEEWPSYSPVALAGLGFLPDNILSRCVVIRMKRRAPDETVEPYRRRIYQDAGHALRDRIAGWIAPRVEDLAAARPVMPKGISDRSEDIWESLLAIADLAVGEWPSEARMAAVTLVTDAGEGIQSLGVRLLADLRAIFKDAVSIATKDIIEKLIDLDESPWGEIRGKGSALDSRKLSNYLRSYGIKSKTIRQGTTTAKGYLAADLFEAWRRYLTPIPCHMETSVTAVTTEEPPPKVVPLCLSDPDAADVLSQWAGVT
jgi:Protein of unknown function (DUF3631)